MVQPRDGIYAALADAMDGWLASPDPAELRRRLLEIVVALDG